MYRSVSRTASFIALALAAVLLSLISYLIVPTAYAAEHILFSPTATPSTITDPDTAAVELGVKFRAATSSTVLGVRFYKGPQNLGTHTAHLWSSTGTLLASATFVNETASGWQEVRFASPVAITANTTYVVSYFAPAGRYSANGNFFAADYTNGILTAPSSAAAGGNGVYRYTAASAFPNQTYNASNYWVDAIVATGGDTPPPATIFTDAFETALTWTRVGDTTWYTGTPKNGTHSVRLRTTGYIEKAIPLTGYQNATVSFTMGAYSLDSASENLQALYYNGTSWVVLAQINNGSANENNLLNPYTVTLPSSVNNLSSFALRFKLNGSGTNDYGFVDDVVVRGTPIQTTPAPTATLSANPTSITQGESSTLTWSSTNSTSCTGTNFSTASATSSTATVSPTQNTTYTLACTGAGGTATTTTSVTVTAPVLTASTSVVPQSGTAPLSVSFTGTASGGTGTYSYSWNFGDGTSASTQQNPTHTYEAAGTYTATLTVTSGTQTDTNSVAVTVSAPTPPTATLSANPTAITQGESSTLTWSSTNSSSCLATGFTTGGATGGSATVSPTATTTYTLACTGAGGTAATDTATVNVTSAPATTLASLLSPSSVPATVTEIDPSAVELGVKFKSSSAGTVLGVRFYKGSQNLGAHTGSIWTTSGTRLATATFVNETASGWQEVRFSSPVTITANTTYVASYFAPQGMYSANGNYFAADYTNGILTAPSSAAAGGNGVYRYSAASAFPNQTYNASNYWVDVVVEGEAGAQPPASSTTTVWAEDPWINTTGGTVIPTSAVIDNPDNWQITMLKNDTEQVMVGVMNEATATRDVSVSVEAQTGLMAELAVLGAIEARSQPTPGLVNIFTPAQVRSFGGSFPSHFVGTAAWRDFPVLHLARNSPVRLWFKVSSQASTPAGQYAVTLTTRDAATQAILVQKAINVEVLAKSLPDKMPIVSLVYGGADEATDKTYHTTAYGQWTNHQGFKDHGYYMFLLSAGLLGNGDLSLLTDLYNSDPALFRQRVDAALDVYYTKMHNDGWTDDQILVEIIDEPGLSSVAGFGLVATEVKRYKPDAKIVTNSGEENLSFYTGMNPYVDVWVPHGAVYLGSPQIRDFLKSTGKPLWYYSNWLGDQVRNESEVFNLFRRGGWLAIKYDLQGMGFWAATWYYGDIWDDFDGEWQDAGTVFPSSAGPIVTRPYEAWRENVEDTAIYKLVRDAYNGGQLSGEWIARANSWLASSANTALNAPASDPTPLAAVRKEAWAIMRSLSVPAPAASLTANPTSITSGQSSTLTWTSTNSSSCLGTSFSTGGSTSGTATILQLASKC